MEVGIQILMAHANFNKIKSEQVNYPSQMTSFGHLSRCFTNCIEATTSSMSAVDGFDVTGDVVIT